MSYYVIGLDIGTTSVKAVAFDYRGTVLSEFEKKYPILYPTLNWAEQDPLIIEKAAIHVLRTVLEKTKMTKDKLKGIGLSSAMHALICVTEDGDPLSNSIIWADARSEVQANQLKVSNPILYNQTGTPLHPMSPLSKFVWMKEQEWKPYNMASKFVSIKEFIIKRWFNQEVVDYSIASATGLFDIEKLDWNENALKTAGITKDNLFSPVSPTYQLRGLKADVAIKIGIDQQLPFVIGASDGPLANLGVGAVEPGDTAITIGTSCAVRQFTDKPVLNKDQALFSYRFDKNLWITGGPSNNGGNILAWLQSLFSADEEIPTIDKMNKLAGHSPPGAHKLLFLPYINGERAPIWDAAAKGTFIGLTSTHTKSDLIKAAMEGVVFNVYQVAQALEKRGNKQRNLFVSGGFAQSNLWVGILADIFGQQVYIPKSHQSSAWGAAWLALISIGEVASLTEIKKSIPMKETITPNATNHLYYKQLYGIFETVYSQISPIFDQLNKIE